MTFLVSHTLHLSSFVYHDLIHEVEIANTVSPNSDLKRKEQFTSLVAIVATRLLDYIPLTKATSNTKCFLFNPEGWTQGETTLRLHFDAALLGDHCSKFLW